MNYCTKCGSLYAQPGTCNCFAPPRLAPPVIGQPQPTMPYIGDPPSTLGGTIGTIQVRPLSGTTVSYDGSIPFTYTAPTGVTYLGWMPRQ